MKIQYSVIELNLLVSVEALAPCPLVCDMALAV